MKNKANARPDLADVKRAAQGRWTDILPVVCGINATLLDERHHPCPKCDGTDRFRLLDKDAGAVFCNQCFSTKNGDGFAAIQWMKGCDFSNAVRLVAEYLNLSFITKNGCVAKNKSKGKCYPNWQDASNALKSRLGSCAGLWGYKDANGSPVALVLRFNRPNGTKEFRPISLHDGKWYIKDPPGMWPLYRLPDLASASTVYICEGEKAADAARKLGLVATTSAHGAKSAKMSDWSPIAGKTLIYLPDNDDDGRLYVRTSAEIVTKLSPVTSVKMVELPGLPSKGDIFDWIKLRGDAAKSELATLVDAAPLWIPPVSASKPQSQHRGEVVEEVDDPHRLARDYLELHAKTATGDRTLVFWRGEFWQWNGVAYEAISESELRGKLTASVKAWFDMIAAIALKEWQEDTSEEKGDPPKAKRVTRPLIANVLNALESMTCLASNRNQPCWLIDNPPFEADETLVTKSGLLHLPSHILGKHSAIPPTPSFFSCTSLGCKFDASAKCPQWMTFLETLWKGDQQSGESLSEWLGYLLLPNVQHHKMMLIVGPPRSGKGTIGRLLKALLGPGSVANPTLGSLAGSFGLWPLLNKSAAVISDARLSGKVDAVAILERLLSISGGDPQNVDRKCLPTVTAVSLPIRFTILTNELPRLPDASGAIVSRFMILKMTESFLGKEDKELDAKLVAELPGILNWAIRGWKNLRERGRFVQPVSGAELQQELGDLASPVGMFVRERCNVGPQWQLPIIELYKAWCDWCKNHGSNHAGTEQSFGRDLRAVVPGLSMPRPRICGKRTRWYSGIGLINSGPQLSATQSIAGEAVNEKRENPIHSLFD